MARKDITAKEIIEEVISEAMRFTDLPFESREKVRCPECGELSKIEAYLVERECPLCHHSFKAVITSPIMNKHRWATQ